MATINKRKVFKCIILGQISFFVISVHKRFLKLIASYEILMKKGVFK